ncbi:MAG: monovalent cation/H(+) antiporter subunit G [Clostridia bacterium]|nr:monovalent cation/H(+) antiporter subunit G [Clostridia bacterium]
MLEYLRLILFALLLMAGLIIQITAVLGVSRFRFSLNRIHAAGMGDTLGLMLICLAAIVYTGLDWIALKIALIVAFFWLTSPVCSHLIGRLIRETDQRLESEAKAWKP